MPHIAAGLLPILLLFIVRYIHPHYCSLECNSYFMLLTAADFSRQLSEFETRADTPPVSLAWCGSDAVVVQWPELLLVIGPTGEHVSWPLVEGKVRIDSGFWLEARMEELQRQCKLLDTRSGRQVTQSMAVKSYRPASSPLM
jgi:hypothetical protein